MRLVPLLVVASLTTLGCDGGSTDPDADAGSVDGDAGDGDRDAGERPDGSVPGDDAGPPGADAGPPDPTCEPTPGPMTGGAYCNQFELALFDVGTAVAHARLIGRLSPDGASPDACVVVDSVEVQEGGATIGTIPGIGNIVAGSQTALLARGDVLPEMASRCGGDTNRFGGFGFIVRGRYDGGSFEAGCADAEGGGRWPPALIVTCHENVDEPPFFGTYAEVRPLVPGRVFTTIDITMPHAPGGEITAADSTMRVIAEAYGFGGGGPAPPPFDITGLAGSVFEGSAPAPGDYTQVSFSVEADPFGETLCPTPDPMPGPGSDPSPVMLLRFTGTSARGGPMSSEAYLDMCQRTPPPAMP